jgi:hypothetical protein
MVAASTPAAGGASAGGEAAAEAVLVRNVALWIGLKRARSDAPADAAGSLEPSARAVPRREGDMLAAALTAARQEQALHSVRLWGTNVPVGRLAPLPRDTSAAQATRETGVGLVSRPAAEDDGDKPRGGDSSTALPRELKAALLRATFDATQLTCI